jgi:hypothetical protein
VNARSQGKLIRSLDGTEACRLREVVGGVTSL